MRWQHFSAPQNISSAKLRSRATRATEQRLWLGLGLFINNSRVDKLFSACDAVPFSRVIYETYQRHCFVENFVGYEFVVSAILEIVTIRLFANDLRNVA